MPINPYNKYIKQYQTSNITTATPEKLMIMLFDGAIQFLQKAKAAIEEKNLAERSLNIEAARKIVRELMRTIDLENGNDVSKSLFKLYNKMAMKLIKANVSRNAELETHTSIALAPDDTYDPGHIVFGWVLGNFIDSEGNQHYMTPSKGVLTFSVSFLKRTGDSYDYVLNTQTASCHPQAGPMHTRQCPIRVHACGMTVSIRSWLGPPLRGVSPQIPSGQPYTATRNAPSPGPKSEDSKHHDAHHRQPPDTTPDRVYNLSGPMTTEGWSEGFQCGRHRSP